MPRQHIDWLRHQYLGPLPISTVAGFVGRGVWSPHILHSDKANGENTACSARPHLRMVPQWVETGSKIATDAAVIARSSVPRRPKLRESNAHSLLISRCGY